MKTNRLELKIISSGNAYPEEAKAECPGCGSIVALLHFRTIAREHKPYLALHKNPDPTYKSPVCGFSLEHFAIAECPI